MDVTTTGKHRPRAEYVSGIIEAGTAACRLYGPSKANVADIARLLGKSPASVYRIFSSKAAIWDAVAGDNRVRSKYWSDRSNNRFEMSTSRTQVPGRAC